MVITKIEGRKIQQHFAQPLGEPDQYIECEFKDENQVIPLNVDQSIDVYGKLHEAFKGKRLWPNSKGREIP